MKKKSYQKSPGLRLERAILAGLAAGLVASVAGGQDASAQTLTEYKAYLASQNIDASQTTGDIREASGTSKVYLNSSSTATSITAEGPGFVNVSVEPDSAVTTSIVTTNEHPNAAGGYTNLKNGGTVAIQIGTADDLTVPTTSSDWTVSPSEAKADLTNTTIKADSGSVTFLNGTATTKASNLYGGKQAGLDNSESGTINIGITGYDSAANAKLVLTGDTTTAFNTSDWTNDASVTVTPANANVSHGFIKLNPHGTLEAKSAQIFQSGLGDDGLATDPKGLRTDAASAIYFYDGVLLLDDAAGNATYLSAAQSAVRSNDGGDTTVELQTPVKDLYEPTSSLADLFSGRTYGSATDGKLHAIAGNWKEQTLFIDKDGSLSVATTKGWGGNDALVTGWTKRTGSVAEIGEAGSAWTYVFIDPEANGAKVLDGATVWVDEARNNDGDEDGGDTQIGYLSKEAIQRVKHGETAEATALYQAANGASSDMTGTRFEARSGTIAFVNGTTKVKASNLFGDAKGKLSVGLENNADTAPGTNWKVTGSVELAGNTLFNVDSWTAGDGVTHSPSSTSYTTYLADKTAGKAGANYIVIEDNGKLIAPSAQIFQSGLGDDGTNRTPVAVRNDADYAIYFKSGTLVLNDGKYNTDYLNSAAQYVHDADTVAWNNDNLKTYTDVEVAPTATAVTGSQDVTGSDPSRTKTTTTVTLDSALRQDIANVANNSFLAGVNAGTSALTLATTTNTAQDFSTFNAQSLDLDATADGSASSVNVTDGIKFRLGSSAVELADGEEGVHEVLTVGKARPETPVALTITNGSLELIGDGNNIVNADISLGANPMDVVAGTKQVNSITGTAGTTLTVNGAATLKANTVTVNGSGANVGGTNVSIYGTLNAGKVTMTNSTVKIAGTVETDDLDASGSIVTIGSDTAAGRLVASQDATLTGATITLDPVWKDGTDIADASSYANLSNGTVDYNLTVGRNSLASIGASTETAQAAFATSRQSWGQGDITAALYLGTQTTLADGNGLTVDGTSTAANTTGNVARFANGSLLMVDAETTRKQAIASTATHTAALSAANTTASKLTVEPNAKLYLHNAKAGETYKIVEGFSDVSEAHGWYDNQDKVLTDYLLTPSNIQQTSDNGLKITLAFNEDSPVYRQSAMKNIEKNLVTNGTYDETVGGRYISAAINSTQNTEAQAIHALNLAAQPAEVAGATASALRTSIAFADTAQHHLSLFQLPDEQEAAAHTAPLPESEKAAAKENKAKKASAKKVDKGEAVWVKYAHESGSIDGLEGTGLDTDADTRFNGITVGYDFANRGALRQGVAVSYGSGDATNAEEKDSFKTTGVSYYGAYRMGGSSNLLYDLGYYHTNHDIDGVLSIDDMDSNIVTAGLRQEWSVPLGKGGTLVPHVGLRYTYLDTPAYTAKWNGADAFRYTPESMSLFQLPVGVGYMQEWGDGNMKYHFGLDLSYVPVLGDRNNNMTVTIPGLTGGYSDLISYEVADGADFVGTLGFGGKSDTLDWQIGYTYRTGGDSDASYVTAGLNFKF